MQPGLEDAVGQPRRIAEAAVSCADPEVLSLQLQHHGPAGDLRLFQPRRNLFRQRPQHRHEIGRRGEVDVECGFRRYALGAVLGLNASFVLAARQVIEPISHAAVAAHQLGPLHALQLHDRTDAVTLQRRRKGLADAPDHGHRLFGEEGHGLGFADYRQAARLAEVRRDLGEKLAVGKSARDGDADGLFDVEREFREHHGRRHGVQPFGA